MPEETARLPVRGPVAAYLDDAAARPHDDGSLTLEYGFLAPRMDVRALGPPHQAWEDAAAMLPRLAFSSQAQTTLDKVPLLPADPEHLPDEQVKRAATLLGMIAHGYWRFGLDNLYAPRNNQVSSHLPDEIRQPWAELCRRLDRPFTGMTFDDSTFNNVTLVDQSLLDTDGAYRVEDVRTDRLAVMVPAYANKTEQVFLCANVEIHAALLPAVQAVPRLEALMADGSPRAAAELTRELRALADCVRAVIRAFRKISSDARSETFCDPIEWAKTIGWFLVPAPGNPVGPSGAAAPVVHFLDALIGRRDYDSEQGLFTSKMLRSQLPRKHREFVDLVRAMDLRGWVEGLRERDPQAFGPAVAAFNALVDVFAGTEGFLGVHKAKVLDFLTVGTLVGRNQSTGHRQTYVNERSWLNTADSLHIAMEERTVRAIPQG